MRRELEENLEEVVDPYMMLILHFLGVAEGLYREAQTQRRISKQRFIPEYKGCEIWLMELRIEIRLYSRMIRAKEDF